jgi:geranylgeranyl pyrophosphate synthase
MAAICSDATTEQQQALDDYSNHLGLGFQVHDDILDIESDTQTLGKTQGADIKLNKQTYPALLGLDAAKALRQHLIVSAKQALADANIVSSNLDQLADYIIQRNH